MDDDDVRIGITVYEYARRNRKSVNVIIFIL